MMIKVVVGACAVASLSLGLLMTYATEPSHGPALAPRTEKVDAALQQGDVSTAVRARRESYVRALGSRRWEDMLAVGDASLRIGQAAGTPAAVIAEARQAYLVALYRAHAAGSAEGALRAAEAFAGLGDGRVAEQCLVVAARLAGRSRDGRTLERVRAASERVRDRLRAEAGEGGPP